MLIIASHQIDLLPYPGFWNRVSKATIMDLGGVWDWFNTGSDCYHHRVKIGTDDNSTWLTLPIIKHNMSNLSSKYYSRPRQIDIELDRSRMPKFWDKIKGIYRGHPNWKLLSPELENIILNGNHKFMWELNYKLLIWVRDLLKIDTPFSIPINPGDKGTATDKILAQLKTYRPDLIPTIYLSGSGGKNYLDVKKLNQYDIRVVWHDWINPEENYKTVSILSLLMDKDLTYVSELINNS